MAAWIYLEYALSFEDNKKSNRFGCADRKGYEIRPIKLRTFLDMYIEDSFALRKRDVLGIGHSELTSAFLINYRIFLENR